MTDLRRHANGLLMDLATRTPDGATITTLWPEGRRFVLSSQKEHAAEHLGRVYQHVAFCRMSANGDAAL